MPQSLPQSHRAAVREYPKFALRELDAEVFSARDVEVEVERPEAPSSRAEIVPPLPRMALLRRQELQAEDPNPKLQG